MLLGMLFNVSMWYKLSGKTNMAIWITLAGLAVTAVVNIVFMPRYSYWASAFGHLASYLTMFIISAALGAKYYPIPYSWKRIGGIFILMGLAYLGILLFSTPNLIPGLSLPMVVRLVVNTLWILLYCGLAWALLRRHPIPVE